MTMHRGRVGDREVRGKMAELRLVSDKEIEIQQQRMESAAISFRKSLQSIKSSAQETVSNQEKIGKLKAQLRAAEDDLVKALSVKTRKEAKKMAIADSISATKARIEEHKKIVADQRARKDEYAEIISHQCEVLEECEKKHNQDAELREEIGEAISWYNRVLGFRIERGRGIKFIFTNINPRNSKEEYYFTIRLENDNYYLLDCHPHVSEAKKLIQELNITNGLYNFVRTMRTKFQEVSAGSLPEIAFHFQEPSIVTMSAPLSSVSTDSGSGSPVEEDHPRQANRVLRKARHLQGGQLSILSPGSASSLRRSQRFKVKK
ncbi:kinetochore protein spc25 isoform X2 [Cynara cardunculus var. scolymus]|uniref:kinetochore protein spc25 isoform X2 n=1 Tax=Cynara cardunculus var. scolymus TaxID=59895 RepID=UPI000D62F05C|nr:kinetochore protein spc25 isoform X2 [Cynara cardunculus var. scolymus]